MTVEELNGLIARGAAQPGIREIEELMRLCRALDDQARDLVALYGAGVVSTAASSTEVRSLPAATHAHMG
jgi:hypothetical protein